MTIEPDALSMLDGVIRHPLVDKHTCGTLAILWKSKQRKVFTTERTFGQTSHRLRTLPQFSTTILDAAVSLTSVVLLLSRSKATRSAREDSRLVACSRATIRIPSHESKLPLSRSSNGHFPVLSPVP